MQWARDNLLDFAAGQADRADLVRKICEYFGVPVEQVEGEVVRRCVAFNIIVQEGIAAIGVAEETRTALEELSKKTPLYVNTATPKEAVLESLEQLGLLELFAGRVYGRPGTKLENLKDIIREEGVLPGDVTFVDDQPTGWAVAEQVGCRFVGIYTERNTAWHNSPQSFPIIRSLAELPKFI